MEEEKKVLPTPPKELNQNRPVPPRPPVIPNKEQNASTTAGNVSAEQNSAPMDSQNIKEEVSQSEIDKSKGKGKTKKEKFWNRKPVLWSGIVLGVALVGLIVFFIVAF